MLSKYQKLLLVYCHCYSNLNDECQNCWEHTYSGMILSYLLVDKCAFRLYPLRIYCKSNNKLHKLTYLLTWILRNEFTVCYQKTVINNFDQPIRCILNIKIYKILSLIPSSAWERN